MDGHVRAAAQVLPIALPVQTDRLARRNGADDLCLVVLADLLEMRHRLIARQHAAMHRQILGGDLRHALFDGRQILGGEGPLVGEIVVKAVLDHRADGDLRLGEELLHRIRQQVRGGMTDDLESVGILVRDDAQFGVVIDDGGGINQHAVDLAGERRLGKPGADARGHLGHADRAIE